MSDAPEKHEWFNRFGLVCCRKCGFVRNATSDERPCKGIVTVALREDIQHPWNGCKVNGVRQTP